MADRDFAQQPLGDYRAPARVQPAGLREIETAHDAEAGRQHLQEHCHQARQQHDPQQRIAEARATREIGGPVARVHVADGNQVAGPEEAEQAPRREGVGWCLADAAAARGRVARRAGVGNE